MPAKRKHSKTQAPETCFELHTLGWKAFQNLATTIVGEVFGQTVQTFFDSRDGGRDGAFHGTWKPTASESFFGSFTVQCKFSAKPGKQLSLADVSGELAKAARLAKRGLTDNYLLFTNAHITGSNDEKLQEAFTAIPGIRHFASYGLERVSQIIRESSRLRMLVPRVYGLGDLSQILDERAYAQAREILSALGDDLGKFVITDAYKRSARALVEHGFVLLLGEPACGKATIAAALAVAATDEWGCSTLKIRDAGDFVKHSNPHEPKQFFWVDDAFGATQCDWQSTSAWNAAFPHIQAAIRRGARVVFTSRDYIYRSARRMLKETALPVFRESQVVIEVERLAPAEREQILYNHLRLGTQTPAKRSILKPHLPSVASHHRFSPEIARRLGNPIFTNGLLISEAGLADFVERPLDFLCEVIRNLDSESRAALALVFMRAGALKSPLSLSAQERNALELMGGSIAGVREALKALEGSLALLVVASEEHLWKFKHPTIRDAFARIIADDRELMDIYLVGTPLETLFDEVTCGVGDVAGAKVNVPADRYEPLVRRIGSLNLTKDDNRRSVHYFLSYRCDKRMLETYVQHNPAFIGRLHVGSYLSAISEVVVLVRLQAFGLLPEEKRQEIVAEIRDLAVSKPDAGFLDEDVRTLFTSEEFEDTLSEVREELIPHLDDKIDNWRWDFRGNQDDDPEAHFEELVSALGDFCEAFETDVDAVRLIAEALTNIKEVIEELQSELPEEPDSDDFRPSSRSESADDGGRSIFDDVDA
jgi:hypothetical protein